MRLLGLGFLGLLLFWVANLVLPYGWIERLQALAGGPPTLPSCSSAITEGEMVAQFGSLVRFVNNAVPFAGVSLRRSREIAVDPAHTVRRCEGEVSSILGSGQVLYDVQWYDPHNPSLSQIRVTIFDGSLPSIFKNLH
jgi:hypothetical protein